MMIQRRLGGIVKVDMVWPVLSVLSGCSGWGSLESENQGGNQLTLVDLECGC